MKWKAVYAAYGETISIPNQWAAETEKRDTTVSSSAWEYSGSGTLSGASLSTPLATTNLAPLSSGRLRNTVTLANGEVLIGDRDVIVSS